MSGPVLFQFLPPLAPDEYAALEASIREHGVKVPILVDERGVVIDGHHRKAIAEHLGVHCPQTRVFEKTDAEKRTLALTLNLDRRNLNREQRRAIVEASIKADPHLSDRAHAQRTGVDHKTVGAARQRLELGGESPHLSRSTSSETGRITTASGVVIAEVEHHDLIDFTTGEVVTDQHDEPAPRPAHVVGLDGKSYSRPDSKASRRPALTDTFWRATQDLTRKVESVVRLATDDRFGQNAEKVAMANRSDLIRAIEALQRVVDQLPERNNS